MATYAEILQAGEDENLKKKVRVAVVIAAEAVRTELVNVVNHTNRLKWAKSVFVDPDTAAKRMVWAVLAQNKDATLAAITGASDSAVQAAVNAAVDVFSDGA